MEKSAAPKPTLVAAEEEGRALAELVLRPMMGEVAATSSWFCRAGIASSTDLAMTTRLQCA
jgi:hypothetical protein